MRPARPTLKGLWQAFDETTFGQDRTLNLRESLPSAIEARARAESWLRMRQVMKPDDVLVITGRGNQSVNGVGVVREAIMGLLPSLRRRGVVASWREHTPGSIVVTLAPVTSLLSAPRRNREREPANRQPGSGTPPSLSALEPETLSLLRRLATRTIESLGVADATPFVEDEMQRTFATLSKTLPLSTDREGKLQRAMRSAIDELEG
ncbi:MAG: hypothetical protein ABI875_00045 [Gemmatimonadales bacterium]